VTAPREAVMSLEIVHFARIALLDGKLVSDSSASRNVNRFGDTRYSQTCIHPNFRYCK